MLIGSLLRVSLVDMVITQVLMSTKLDTQTNVRWQYYVHCLSPFLIIYLTFTNMGLYFKPWFVQILSRQIQNKDKININYLFCLLKLSEAKFILLALCIQCNVNQFWFVELTSKFCRFDTQNNTYVRILARMEIACKARKTYFWLPDYWHWIPLRFLHQQLYIQSSVCQAPEVSRWHHPEEDESA